MTRDERNAGLRFVAIFCDVLMLALAESGDGRAQAWVDVTKEIAVIEAPSYEWPRNSWRSPGEREAFIEGMYQALCAIEDRGVVEEQRNDGDEFRFPMDLATGQQS